jgi:hypothetical protein
MKKILMIFFIIGFVFVGNALADEFVSGTLTVLDMTVWESQQCIDLGNCGEAIRACDVFFNYVTDSDQEYFLFASAHGNALNGALWKAALDGVPVRSTLRFIIQPLVIDIVNVTWGRIVSPL